MCVVYVCACMCVLCVCACVHMWMCVYVDVCACIHTHISPEGCYAGQGDWEMGLLHESQSGS